MIATMIGDASAQTPAKKVDAPKGFDSLTWLAGTRYIERNGSRSYETWTGPSGGLISGSVASATGGGLVEYFRIGPNEDGVYGLMTANSTRGLTDWSFRPMKSLEAGRIVFADDKGSFSIESTPDGGIHNIATRVENGQERQTGEWFWLPLEHPKTRAVAR
jgi:hypothetical protein